MLRYFEQECPDVITEPVGGELIRVEDDPVLVPAGQGLVDGLVVLQQNLVGEARRDLAVLHQLVQRILQENETLA